MGRGEGTLKLLPILKLEPGGLALNVGRNVSGWFHEGDGGAVKPVRVTSRLIIHPAEARRVSERANSAAPGFLLCGACRVTMETSEGPQVRLAEGEGRGARWMPPPFLREMVLRVTIIQKCVPLPTP